jgi:hypothetical protein
MLAAVRCWELVQKAVLAIQQAQTEMADAKYNDFDRLAINKAAEHLENALRELVCFCPKGLAAGFDVWLPGGRDR